MLVKQFKDYTCLFNFIPDIGSEYDLHGGSFLEEPDPIAIICKNLCDDDFRKEFNERFNLDITPDSDINEFNIKAHFESCCEENVTDLYNTDTEDGLYLNININGEEESLRFDYECDGGTILGCAGPYELHQIRSQMKFEFV